MRILIIGGTGFCGPYIVRRLDELGHELLLFHRGQTEACLPAGVNQIYGDRRRLADSAAELRRFAPQIVLDMIPSCQQDARDLMDTFKGITRRVVAISSQDVYRAYGILIGLESGPLEPIPLGEGSPLRERLYPYREGASPDHGAYHYEKILVERTFMADPALPGTILRFPMVYGPGDHRQHRLFDYLKRMDDHRPAILLEEGLANWRWTKGYVENVAAATVLAVTGERAAGRIYNVGEKETLTELEWVRAIGQAVGWEGRVLVVAKDRLPGHLLPGHNTQQHLVADTTRIRAELGYEEAASRDEALRRTVAWEQMHPPETIDPHAFDYASEDALLLELAGHDAGSRA